jgi:hypothetical protein
VFAAPSHLSAVLERLDRERRNLFPAGISGEALPAVTRLHGIAGDWHQIAFSALSQDDADRVIAEQAAHYRSLGANVEWAAYAHDAPEDLLRRLERHGFELGPREAVVVLDARVQRQWLDAPAAFRVDPVGSARELRAFAAAAEEIFGADQTPVVRELEARLLEGSSQHIAYLGYVGSEVAAVGRLHTHPDSQFAGLYGGGTREAYRGRGLYRAVVARRARDAVQAGARYLRVDALPTSQPILERLGFELLTYLWPCVLVE